MTFSQETKTVTPDIIHFAWVGKELPEENVRNILEYHEKYPHAQIHIWMDEDRFSRPFSKIFDLTEKSDAVPGYIHLHSFNDLKKSLEGKLDDKLIKKLFLCIEREIIGNKNSAAVSDILRLLALFLKGGLYTDSKNKILQKLDFQKLMETQNLGSYGVFIVPGGMSADGSFCINNHTIIASPGSPIIKAILENIVKAYDDLDQGKELKTDFGPVSFTIDDKRKFVDPAVLDDQDPLEVASRSPRAFLTLRTTGPGIIAETLDQLITEGVLSDKQAGNLLLPDQVLAKSFPIFKPKLSWLFGKQVSYDDSQIKYGNCDGANKLRKK